MPMTIPELKTEIRRNLAKGYHLKGAISTSKGNPARDQFAWDLLQAVYELGKEDGQATQRQRIADSVKENIARLEALSPDGRIGCGGVVDAHRKAIEEAD